MINHMLILKFEGSPIICVHQLINLRYRIAATNQINVKNINKYFNYLTRIGTNYLQK